MPVAALTTMTPSSKALVVPDWPAPRAVRSLLTTRRGGVSRSPYASLNLGDHVGDDRSAVAANRASLRAALAGGGDPLWLEQVHGTRVVNAAAHSPNDPPLAADASFSREKGVVCAVMTADCLPVLFCDRAGSTVAAAHAGWRGLAGGVLQNTVAAMKVPPLEIMAYLGPAIGADAFEVGQDVWDAFCLPMPRAEVAFTDIGAGKYLADIYALARLVLQDVGVNQIYGGQHCTVLERDVFFSYRRDGQTGRMVSAVWLE